MTPDDVRQLPADGNRYECVDGMLLGTPGPSYDHQYLVLGLIQALDQFLSIELDMRFHISRSDVEIEQGTLVQHDLFVPVERPCVTRIHSWHEIGSLHSPSRSFPGSSLRGRGRNRPLYQRARACEYWIVDPEARLVERRLPTDTRPQILRDELLWSPSGVVIGRPSLVARSLCAVAGERRPAQSRAPSRTLSRFVTPETTPLPPP